MTTLTQVLQILRTNRNQLRADLASHNINTSATALPDLLSLVPTISSGGEYYYVTTVISKTNSLHIGAFNFMPETFSYASDYALNHSYTLAEASVNVLGVLSLVNLAVGTQTHTISILLNGMTSQDITVTTVITESSGSYTLDIILPAGYFFLGESEWAVLGPRWVDDEDWDQLETEEGTEVAV